MASKGFTINDIIDFEDEDFKEKSSQSEILEAKHEEMHKTGSEVNVKEEPAIKEAEKREPEAEAGSHRKAAAREPESAPPNKPYFFLISEEGEEIPARTLPASIGRSENCTCIIDGASISRNHAEVTEKAGKFYLEDKSTAGTYLAMLEDGKPVIKRLGKDLPKQVEITDGQIIQLATKIYTFVQRK